MRYVGIDPSTKTGFVALDEEGQVQRAKELTGIGDIDPKRITTLVGEVIAHIKPGDFIAVEGFSYNSQGRGIGFQFGIGYAIRIALYSRNIPYIEVSPGQLKKFATGKGNTPKDKMPSPIQENWGFTDRSDNVLDAYVLARCVQAYKNFDGMLFRLTDYQREVIETIISPQPKSKPKKKKKAK
ncbi:hypothetical protein RYX56_05495 [Alkalihalophilus lindianensis]|uniref:Holliday junction resolvase RuvC n=1 Tax=Alkalihalophilus lindianensis TaxID=1630542 RepID=A0ABU3X7F5_9BACI|nr:hypothetical protein [Alkalihalophilus lindianensis]MDV2683762.1 hypothetical protein [Alkalihalophilus lindianensis]MDV2683828.1 hypothetical protein [Alkalihalophilus lindianensis]